MKLISLAIQNFRCFKEEVSTPIADLTTFVGQNDIGKTSILEALEIFFNNEAVKIDSGDANVFNRDNPVVITCEFTDLPVSLTLDAGATTSLANEYLLTGSGTLCIRKVYDCAKATKITPEVQILAHHPTAKGVENLLELKEKDLQKIVKDKALDAKMKGNPGMRSAIWASVDDLNLQTVLIVVSGAKDERKVIWDQIEGHLPVFAIFQSDRSSRDSDDEVQNPMKAAIAAAIAEVQGEIEEIQRKVKEKAETIARRTHEALKTLDANLAKELSPQFKPPTASKWTGLFSVSMDTEDGIPLNKRGSGVRRMVLVGFFKAEAERRLESSSRRSIIYAIEEPETAQHPNNQRILIDSFKSLANESGCQVILTTHSPGLASELPAESIRFIHKHQGQPSIQAGADVFGEVAKSLGLIPDSRVKVILCVEGPTDVTAFKCLSRALHLEDRDLPDLSRDERVAFVVLGGSTLKHWVNEHYLRQLNCPEVHIYDSDVKKYAQSVQRVNQRTDGSWAAQTKKHEIESYLHADAIRAAFAVDVEVVDHPVAGKPAVPMAFAAVYSKEKKLDNIMGDDKAKNKLAEKAFAKMTAAMIRERDPEGEVEQWFRSIGRMLG
jgi:putative ATP-dependent endonuclease of the OLD family